MNDKELILMKITGKTIDAFRKDFEQAMSVLEEKYDVTVSLGHITYWNDRFSAKVTVNNGRDPEQIMRAKFDANVWKYSHLGFDKGMYMRVFTGHDGLRYAIEGFNPKARKYPLEAIRINDEGHYRLSEQFLVQLENEYYIESETR